MDKSPKKEAEEGPSKEHLKHEAEDKLFQFRLNSELYSVVCNTSMTVIDALNTNDVFKTQRNKPKNKDKAVLLLRSAGPVPRAAVKPDFPCCLTKHNEMIDVTFITNDARASAEDETPETKQPSSFPSKPDMFVTFYVKKMGGDKVKYLLQSKVLRERVEYVCVHAYREDELIDALKRDGRFTRNIFSNKKHCVLSEFGTESRHLMSQPVQHLDQKIFKVVVDKLLESQDDETSVKTEPVADSDADVGTSQNPDNTEQTAKPKKETVKSTRASAKLSDIKVIPNSEEILKILRNQFKGLVKQLKQRENLKNQSQVQNFFRGEFAKSFKSFLEVKTMKQMAKLSDSVCQIRVEGEPMGTGFLFVDRFILTNGHVIDPFASSENLEQSYPMRLHKPVTIVFNFEDYQSQLIELPVKREICAFAYKTNSHLDYALLELEADAPGGIPELLCCHSYSPPRAGSQICIVGHPGEGVKKVDPCVIVDLICIVGHPGEGVKKVDPCVIVDLNEERLMGNPHYAITEQYFDNKITYNSCFDFGSSGSPVFDKDGYLIGIHTGYFTHNMRTIEYAHPMQPILENIRIQTENKKEKGRISILLKRLDQHMDISSI